MNDNYFLNMIKNLREHEEIMLYGNILNIDEKDTFEVVEFLKNEYQLETLEYPYKVPKFDEKAALWAAQTVYIASQLMLYRENKDSDIELLLPDYTGEFNASAILSCDLCLRFLTEILFQLKLIDSEDILIQVLEHKLNRWHYSGINYALAIEKLDFKDFFLDICFEQLYINRIIEYKKVRLASHPSCKNRVAASMGIFAQDFWNDFKLETSIDG